MNWQDLLSDSAEQLVIPWTGRRTVSSNGRIFKVKGNLPEEHGWYLCEVISPRNVKIIESADPDFDWEEGLETFIGYLIGDRFVPDTINFKFDPEDLSLISKNGFKVHLIEPGLDRFTRVMVAKNVLGNYIYVRTEFPLGPEFEVVAAYQDKKDSVDNIAGVIPSLDLAFKFETWYRTEVERRRAEAEAKRLEEERKAALIRAIGTGEGRRELAQVDFGAACKAALQVSGAEYLDHRDVSRHEVAVQYRFKNRRLECTVNKHTLRIIDAGVCLDDHAGTKGDTFFTLESLPAVIDEAIRRNKLVVWRHI